MDDLNILLIHGMGPSMERVRTMVCRKTPTESLVYLYVSPKHGRNTSHNLSPLVQTKRESCYGN